MYVKLDTEDAEEYGAVMDDMYHLAQKEAAHGNVRNEIYLLRFIFNVSYLRGYYASVGDLEQSDFYFLSMWNSSDQVKMRPYYDMSALTGLAINAMKRGKIETSLRVFRLCFAQLQKESFFSLSVRVALYIAECYCSLFIPEETCRLSLACFAHPKMGCTDGSGSTR